MTADWYVLIEEDTRTTQRADGTDLKLHRWMLTGTHCIGPDRAEAVAAAEDAALHHIPGILARHTRPGDEPARHALLTQDGAWIVLVKQRHRECHIRVTTAQLVHSREEKEAPSKSLKEKLRSAMDGPAPAPKPWSWTPEGKADRT
ncbi:hypothetical protein GCM10010275_71510 [Streptomyces litmocidini]|uniref:hypothetical protein n=1 Tax=Streptomyces litmocidini TaxID=67318 RepID=UPI00167DB04A|nr:hypothetical protein [Streptomyces litmocidini]GGV19468.1 hypothetical protein GCM10010275_71510 [Streptomyces litmocidini]